MYETLMNYLKSIPSFPKKIEETEVLKLADAHYRTLAKDVVSPINLPDFPRSAFDGFALGEEEENTNGYRCLDVTYAGDVTTLVLKPGECMKVMTGAMVPQNARCVVKKEHTHEEDGRVVVDTMPTKPNIMPLGEDMHKGDVLLEANTTLDAYALSILAAAGFAEIEVYRLPKALVMTNGNELLALGDAPEVGKIYNSNSPFFTARMQEWNTSVTDFGIVPDDKERLRTILADAATKYDIVVSTGGMSVGDKDFLPALVQEMATEILFTRLPIKPGGHVAVWKIKDCVFVTLSGNPYAALAVGEMLIPKVLYGLTGASRHDSETYCAVLSAPFRNKRDIPCLIRGRLKHGTFEIAERQLSSVVSEFKHANAIWMAKPYEEREKGDVIFVEKIR